MNDKPGVRPEGCYQHRVKGTWVCCTCGKYQQPRNGDTLTGTPEPRNVCPAPGGSNHHERAHQGAGSPHHQDEQSREIHHATGLSLRPPALRGVRRPAR
jgi:hypothetical protein